MVILFLFNLVVNDIYCSSGKNDFITFSSFEANKDSIPTFNLWYSWSNKEDKGVKKDPIVPSR